MTQYVDGEYRQVDGPYSQAFWQAIPFTNMRETVTNDLTGTTSIGANGSPGIAITTLLHKHSTPALEYANADTDSALRLRWATTEEDPVVFQIPLPPHLDVSQDLSIKIYAAMGGTTDSVFIYADSYFDSGDTKVSDKSDEIDGTTATEYTITIDSSDIPTGARTMTVELTPAESETHTSDTLLFFSCWVEGKVKP